MESLAKDEVSCSIERSSGLHQFVRFYLLLLCFYLISVFFAIQELSSLRDISFYVSIININWDRAFSSEDIDYRYRICMTMEVRDMR